MKGGRAWILVNENDLTPMIWKWQQISIHGLGSPITGKVHMLQVRQESTAIFFINIYIYLFLLSVKECNSNSGSGEST